jgi:hypothetical protein
LGVSATLWSFSPNFRSAAHDADIAWKYAAASSLTFFAQSRRSSAPHMSWKSSSSCP